MAKKKQKTTNQTNTGNLEEEEQQQKTPEQALGEFLQQVPVVLESHENALTELTKQLTDIKKAVSSLNEQLGTGEINRQPAILQTQSQKNNGSKLGEGLMDLIGNFMKILPDILKGPSPEQAAMEENYVLFKAWQKNKFETAIQQDNVGVDLSRALVKKAEKDLLKGDEWEV